jgi:hypothetical protein
VRAYLPTGGVLLRVSPRRRSHGGLGEHSVGCGEEMCLSITGCCVGRMSASFVGSSNGWDALLVHLEPWAVWAGHK